MGYRLEDIEITRPLAKIRLSVEDTGIGALIRRHARPIGFLLRELPRASIISAETLGEWLAEEFKEKILSEAIEDEFGRCGAGRAMPPVTVAICSHSRPVQLDRCLQSLLPLQLRHGFEILVVDNASPDSSLTDVVRHYPSVRYAREERVGLDFARNRACTEGGGEWVAFLDDDIVADENWFAGLQEAWSENPDAAAITGLVVPLSLKTNAQVIFEYRGGFRRGFDKRRFRQELPGNDSFPCGAGIFGVGANMAFRRDFLCKIGGFDEALDTGAPLPGGGDLDIFYRISCHGGIIAYEPRMLVFHEHRAEIGALRRQYYTWGLGLMAYACKHMEVDSSQRAKFFRLIRWWVRDELRQLWNAVRGEGVPPQMILAELHGAFIGWMGEYRRSCQRISVIKKNAL